MEQLLLKVLEFDVSNSTTVIFLTHICVHCNVPLKVMYLAMYLGEMSLLEADPYSSYTPSMIASGAVSLARLILDYKVIWPENMAELTNYSLNDLIPILKHLNHTYKTAPHSQQSAIRSKYKSARYHSVSEIEYNKLIVPPRNQVPSKHRSMLAVACIPVLLQPTNSLILLSYGMTLLAAVSCIQV